MAPSADVLQNVLHGRPSGVSGSQRNCELARHPPDSAANASTLHQNWCGRHLTRNAVALALVVIGTGPLLGQGPGRVGLTNRVARLSYPAMEHYRVAVPDSARGNHWLEGTIIGAVAVWGTMAILSRTTVSNGIHPTLVIGGILAGGVIGGMIGWSRPKSQATTAVGIPLREQLLSGAGRRSVDWRDCEPEQSGSDPRGAP